MKLVINNQRSPFDIEIPQEGQLPRVIRFWPGKPVHVSNDDWDNFVSLQQADLTNCRVIDIEDDPKKLSVVKKGKPLAKPEVDPPSTDPLSGR